MSNVSKPAVVVSEPDLLAALVHLRALPHQQNWPEPLNRQHVVNLIRQAMPKTPKLDDGFCFGPGLYGIIKPFGVDLAGIADDERRLQVWVAIRHAATAPHQLTEL